jgi:hypothetical protein
MRSRFLFDLLCSISVSGFLLGGASSECGSSRLCSPDGTAGAGSRRAWRRGPGPAAERTPRDVNVTAIPGIVLRARSG